MERIGHRGAPSLALENTLPSFQQAVTLGVDGIELDVQLSADGQLMVLHDATLARTHRRSEAITDLSAVALVEAGVPTYESVLALLAGCCAVTCELKGAGTAELAAQLTLAAGLAESTVFTSFDLARVAALKAAQPSLRVGGISGQADGELISCLLALGAELADVHWAALTPAWVESARAAGLRVRAWTVNDEEALVHALAAGVDGIMSDRPEWLLQACCGAEAGAQ